MRIRNAGIHYVFPSSGENAQIRGNPTETTKHVYLSELGGYVVDAGEGEGEVEHNALAQVRAGVAKHVELRQELVRHAVQRVVRPRLEPTKQQLLSNLKILVFHFYIHNIHFSLENQLKLHYINICIQSYNFQLYLSISIYKENLFLGLYHHSL